MKKSEDVKIIRTNQTNSEYQFSSYKIGWVFEVVNDFEETISILPDFPLL